MEWNVLGAVLLEIGNFNKEESNKVSCRCIITNPT